MKNKLEKIQSFVDSLEKEKLCEKQEVTLVIHHDSEAYGGDGYNGTCLNNDYCDGSSNTKKCINIISCVFSDNRRDCANRGDCTGSN